VKRATRSTKAQQKGSQRQTRDKRGRQPKGSQAGAKRAAKQKPKGSQGRKGSHRQEPEAKGRGGNRQPNRGQRKDAKRKRPEPKGKGKGKAKGRAETAKRQRKRRRQRQPKGSATANQKQPKATKGQEGEAAAGKPRINRRSAGKDRQRPRKRR